VRPVWNAIDALFPAQLGASSADGPVSSCRIFPLSRSSVQMSSLPSRSLTNASSVPSGDHAGCPSFASLNVRCVRVSVSRLNVHRSTLPLRSLAKASAWPVAAHEGSVSSDADVVTCRRPSVCRSVV
jgi:hypothetical protein